MDDFVILHTSRKQLEDWKASIIIFLKDKLHIALHPDKSRIIPIKKGIDFIGFRNFTHRRLLRKRNIRAMQRKVNAYRDSGLDFTSLYNSYKGWQAYALWGHTYKLRESMKREIIDILWDKIGK